MPIALTEDEMSALINHLRLESRVSFYRNELEDLHDDASAFGDVEHSEEDRASDIDDAQYALDDAETELQNSDYFPADAFNGTMLFTDLCTQAADWTMDYEAILPKKRLRELVAVYLQENT
jgi:hypothetical protein